MVLRLISTALACAATATLSPASALAQAVPSVVNEVGRCRAIADDARRLACFDGTAGRLATAVEQKQITILDREGIRSTRRSLFGFTLPRVGLFRSDGEAETEIVTTLRSAAGTADGRYDLLMADGARWQSTEPMRFPPRAGAEVKIRRATLGSYWIAVKGQRTVRGRRIG